MIELRCDNKLHGTISDGVIEMRCRSKFCGHAAGTVVIHSFDMEGNFLGTKQFKDPGREQHVRSNG